MTAVAAASRRAEILALLTAGDPDTPLVERVCEVSAALLGVTGAGMCLIGGRSHQVVVHGTTGLASELEDLQFDLGQGPCLHAVQTGSPTLVPELEGHRTLSWPVFAEEARTRGVRALFSFPLESGVTSLGALDLYRDTPGPLTGAQLVDALTLTAIAAQVMFAQRDEVYLDGSVSALHWVATGHPFTGDPAGTVWPDGEPVTRGRAVDHGMTAAQALAPLWPDGGNDLTAADPDEAHRPDPGTEPARPVEPAAGVADGDEAPQPGRLVLVVDDEAGMRLVLGRALARLGYRVLLADTLDGGIALLGQHPELDAVIADVTMPTATGLDFGAAIIEHHPGVPILFLTGGPTASGALDDPLIGLVAKPVAIADLRTQLAELIDRADQIATSTATPDSPAEQSAAGGGVVIGHRGRRIERGGRLGVLPELDHATATWAAVAGLAGMTGQPRDAGPTGLSAVPGARESTRLASLGLFAAGVANEVNNMLAVVSMRADLLTEGEDGQPPTPAAADDVAAITKAAARASGLVQQLMLFAGQRTVDRGPVDVAELVADLRPRLDDVAGGPGIVTCTLEPVPGITADHEHLERVVLNLVRNALEATASSPGESPDVVVAGRAAAGSSGARERVRVRVTPVPAGAPAPGVVVEVADSGQGMTAEVCARAVEPFFRAYTSDGGSGLGLAIVCGIVAQHGGTLDLDSTAGHGTTVRVTLPADPATASDSRPPGEPADAGRAAPDRRARA